MPPKRARKVNDLKPQTIRVAALGDLLFTNAPGANAPGRGLESVSAPLRELFAGCDVVFANLECTLQGERTVPTEPRLIATERQATSMKEAGVNIVSLGNNHAFDCFDEGFSRLRSLLDDLGIAWFGAGENLSEALRPAVMEIRGIKLAFLALVDQSSAPSHFAGETTQGVAPLDTERACSLIENLRSQGNHVIVSPHWGEEQFRVPSPQQVRQAHAFIDAGACAVIGHHPHVLQGMAFYRQAPMAYSLGNFLANTVYWSDGDSLIWDRWGRTGCVLVMDLAPGGIKDIQQVLTYDDGKTINLHTRRWAKRHLQMLNARVAAGITPQVYERERFRVRRIRPIVSHLRWAEFRRLRPRHLRGAVRALFRRSD